MKDWRVPVLTYHGLHAPGWDYHENDHVALEQDLGLIDELGFKVVPLSVLVNHLFCREDARLESGKFVAISFDDGSDFDYQDFSHPDWGYLKSFRNLLANWPQLGWDGCAPRGTSFVIASPAARSELDQTCIAGKDQWRDTWWREAAEDGPVSRVVRAFADTLERQRPDLGIADHFELSVELDNGASVDLSRLERVARDGDLEATAEAARRIISMIPGEAQSRALASRPSMAP